MAKRVRKLRRSLSVRLSGKNADVQNDTFELHSDYKALLNVLDIWSDTAPFQHEPQLKDINIPPHLLQDGSALWSSRKHKQMMRKLFKEADKEESPPFHKISSRHSV
mmetsp:Transcript_11726/g.14600  ORF Transcript_11726/g.14600 Transcript_11726/m.14600 type:complete len:107 (-) Transcript_11726:9-329(-)